MKFWPTYLAMCVLIALLALMGNADFQFATVQTLTPQLTENKPEVLYPDAPKPIADSEVIEARNKSCIENPGFERWVTVFDPLPEDQKRWIKLKTHINAEFTDLDLEDDLPPIFASWFELPDGSRCGASPLKLSAEEATDLTNQSIRYINPELGTFAFSYVVFKRSHDGIVNFSDTSIEVVGINVLYIAAMVFTVGLLLVLIAITLIKHRALYSLPFVAGLFVINLVIVLLMLTSSDKIVAGVSMITKAVGITTEHNIQDYFTIAHAIVFAFSTALALFLRKKTGLSVLKTLALIVLMAFTSEAFQLHVTSRSSTTEDLLYDFAGIISGFLIWLVVHLQLVLLQKISRKNQPTQPQPINHNED